MTTIGPVSSTYAYPANVRRFGDGTVMATEELKLENREAYAQAVAESHNRSDSGTVNPMTKEEVLRRLDESDQMHLRMAQGDEDFLAGKGTPVNGTTQAMMDNAIAQAREARSKPYIHYPGPITIEAMDVGSAVNAQKSLTGGDLQRLSQYGDYLRNEVAAAGKVRQDVSFKGTWGPGHATSDVNEYIGWLMQAMQQAAPEQAPTPS